MSDMPLSKENKGLIVIGMAIVMFVGRYIKNGNAHPNHALAAAADFVGSLEASDE